MIFRMMDNVGYILENKKKKTASLIKRIKGIKIFYRLMAWNAMLDKTPEGGNKKGKKHSCNKLGQEGGVAVGADFMSVRSPERANVMRKSYDLKDLYRFVRFDFRLHPLQTKRRFLYEPSFLLYELPCVCVLFCTALMAMHSCLAALVLTMPIPEMADLSHPNHNLPMPHV